MTSFKSLTRIAAIGTALAAGFLAIAPGRAIAQQSGTWSSAGVTSWNNTARWTGSVVAGGTDATATFTVGGTANLLSSITLGNLATGGTRVQIRSGTESTNSLLTSEYIEFATTSGVPTISNTGRLDMFAVISGSQGFTKSGAGALYINRPSSYTGVTTITAGDVRLGVDAGLGNSSTGNGTVVQTGAIFRLDVAATTSYQGTSITTNEPFTISGTGIVGTGGVLRSQQGANTFAGPITLAADASIACNSTNASLTLSGAINLGSNNLSLIDGGPFTVSGGIAGTGGLNFSNAGSLKLSGSNSFTGKTTIGGDTGLVAITGYMAGETAFSPGAGGRTLIGTGTFAGGLAVGQFATVAPGAIQASDYGTITSSTFSLQSAQLLMGIQNASTFDKLVMTAGSNGLTLGGSANLALDFAGLLPNFSSLKLLDFNGITGSFSGLSSTGSYTGTWVDTSGVWKLAGVGTGGQQDLTFTQSTGVLAVVPEPSTVVLLGGSAAATVLFRLVRRRRVG
jgi:autotransporter-associated beta strand protein